MKKSTVWIASLVLSGFLLQACQSQSSPTNASSTASTEQVTMVGAWEVVTGDTAIDKHPEVKEAFEKALDGLVGADHEPIALLAQQVVSGTNYLYLVKTTAVAPNAIPTFTIIEVYQDLDGKASITGIEDLTENEELDGGFVVQDGSLKLVDNKDVEAIFEEAVEGLVGKTYEGLYYLDSQVVAGTNYRILAKVSQPGQDEVGYALVIVGQDLDGKVSLIEIDEISLDDVRKTDD